MSSAQSSSLQVNHTVATKADPLEVAKQCHVDPFDDEEVDSVVSNNFEEDCCLSEDDEVDNRVSRSAAKAAQLEKARHKPLPPTSKGVSAHNPYATLAPKASRAPAPSAVVEAEESNEFSPHCSCAACVSHYQHFDAEPAPLQSAQQSFIFDQTSVDYSYQYYDAYAQYAVPYPQTWGYYDMPRATQPQPQAPAAQSQPASSQPSSTRRVNQQPAFLPEVVPTSPVRPVVPVALPVVQAAATQEEPTAARTAATTATIMCCYHKQGKCKMGNDCWYSHEGSNDTPCHYGALCKAGHRHLVKNGSAAAAVPMKPQSSAPHRHQNNHRRDNVKTAAPLQKSSMPCAYCGAVNCVSTQEFPIYNGNQVSVGTRAHCAACFRTYSLSL